MCDASIIRPFFNFHGKDTLQCHLSFECGEGGGGRIVGRIRGLLWVIVNTPLLAQKSTLFFFCWEMLFLQNKVKSRQVSSSRMIKQLLLLALALPFLVSGFSVHSPSSAPFLTKSRSRTPVVNVDLR